MKVVRILYANMNVKYIRGAYRLIYVLITLPILCLASCPDSEKLKPHCSCTAARPSGFIVFLTCYAELNCNNIFNPLELEEPVESFVGHEVCQMILSDSYLQYLPRDLFKNTTFKSVNIFQSEFASLSNGDLAFEGLEPHLTSMQIIRSRFFNWDFNHLRYLKELRAIIIVATPIDNIPEALPQLDLLSEFMFSYNGLSYISMQNEKLFIIIKALCDYAFANFPKLKNLWLDHNEISDFKRNMLPVPANELLKLGLGSNKLNELPEDMFYAMPKLEEVYLSGNRLVTIDENVFRIKMGSRFHLFITENPLACDSRLLWLIKTGKSEFTYSGKCEAPKKLKGRYLNSLKTRDIQDI